MLDRSGYEWGIPAQFLQISAARASRASLSCPHFLVADAGVCAAFPLGELLLGLHSLGFNYLFNFPSCYVALCVSKVSAQTRQGECGVWKPLFLKFPSRDRLPFPGRSSLPTSFVSHFVFYIFSYLFSKTMVCFSGCLKSSASLQKLFCGVCSALKCSFEEFV